MDFVFVRRDGHVAPPSPLYDGPYKVLERSHKFFRLQIGSGIDTISIDRLKPSNTDNVVIPAQPPLKGRPPKNPPALVSSLHNTHLKSFTIWRNQNLGGTSVEDIFRQI